MQTRSILQYLTCHLHNYKKLQYNRITCQPTRAFYRLNCFSFANGFLITKGMCHRACAVGTSWDFSKTPALIFFWLYKTPHLIIAYYLNKFLKSIVLDPSTNPDRTWFELSSASRPYPTSFRLSYIRCKRLIFLSSKEI